MAEVKNAAPDQEYNDDGSKNPDFVAPKKEGESGAPATKKDGEDATDGDGDKKGDDPDFDDNATPVIPIRASVAQHIITRKNEKIKKLESKLDKKSDEDADEEGDEDDKDEDGDGANLSDETKDSISREVSKRIAPIVETLVTAADEKELKDLFASEPEAKKYEKHIKAYLTHEQYKGVSPSVIYHHLAFNNAQAVGVKKKSAADLAAQQTRSGGRALPHKSSLGDLPTAEDIAGMTEAEFDKMEEDARQGKYIKK